MGRVTAAKRVGGLVEDIRTRIRAGVWQPGHRLPTERDLAAELGVARNTLRRGLRQLEQAGDIRRHVGRGSFVADRDGNGGRTIETLIALALEASPADVIELRIMLEPWASSLAALRATTRELADMRLCVEQCRLAPDLDAFADWDSRLHDTIVGAAHNAMLSCLFGVVALARRQPGWKMLGLREDMPGARERFEQEHEVLVEALYSRDANRAANVARAHLRSVQVSIQGPEPGSVALP